MHISPNIRQTITDIRERIEIVHTADFGLFLQNVFSLLRDLITSQISSQVYIAKSSPPSYCDLVHRQY